MPASTNTENKKQNEKGIKMQRQQSRSSQFKVSADRKKESDRNAGRFGLRIIAPMVGRRRTLKPNGKNPFTEKVLILGSGVAQEFDSVLVCQGRPAKGRR